MKTLMSLAIALALALYHGSLGAKVAASVVWSSKLQWILVESNGVLYRYASLHCARISCSVRYYFLTRLILSVSYLSLGPVYYYVIIMT